MLRNPLNYYNQSIVSMRYILKNKKIILHTRPVIIEVRVGVVRKANYIKPMLSVCFKGHTAGTDPNPVIL